MQLAEIRRRHEAGENDHIIAEAMGYSVTTIWKWRRALGLPTIGVSGPRHRPIYYVWDAENDTLLAVGTAKQCADMLGLKGGGRSFHVLKARYKAGKSRKYIVMKEEDDDVL